jgi:hypothetical protein
MYNVDQLRGKLFATFKFETLPVITKQNFNNFEFSLVPDKLLSHFRKTPLFSDLIFSKGSKMRTLEHKNDLPVVGITIDD